VRGPGWATCHLRLAFREGGGGGDGGGGCGGEVARWPGP
jgi:hypothetical protein